VLRNVFGTSAMKGFEMTKVPSRVEVEPLVRAEQRIPWRGGWADTTVSGPPATKASVARFRAINAKIDAYEESHRQPAQGVEVVA
jgi:hypothetical protein